MNKIIGVLEFKDFDALVGGKIMPAYLRSTNPNVPTTNKNEAMKVTKSRYRKEFSDKYIFRKVVKPMNDNVNKPSHYQGSKGLESIEVIDNFIGNLPGKAAWCWGNAIKYLLRFQKKNGLEDLKKARKNLDWLIEEMENGL